MKAAPTPVAMVNSHEAGRLPHDDYKAAVANRLKTARGHIDGILRMIETDAWCPDVMKQLSAVQGILDGASRQVLRHHLETHVATAVAAGTGAGLVDELMETFKYDRGLLWPEPTAHQK